MYARVITFHYQPGTVGQAIQFVNDSVLPELKQEEGFQEFKMLVDRSKDKVLGIALFQAEDHLPGAHAAFQRRASTAKIRSLFAAEPVVETYEVAVQG